MARVFRFHAGGQAEALRDAVDRAALEEPLKKGLTDLVARHLKRVGEEADRAGKSYAAPPATAAPAARRRTLDDAIDQALDLARDFNEGQVARWLDDHPAAYQPVQEQIALADAYQRAAAEDPEAVVKAARAAGVAAPQDGELRTTLTTIRDRLAKAADADVQRLREAERKASPKPNPAPAGKSGAAPRNALLPPPPSPEAEALELLGQLTDADAHSRITAAGRETRAEAEKLLTTPQQRKALDDEMLRWFQSVLPPEDSAKDGAPQQPRPAPARKGSSRVDPGF